jgi:hypothetical protein
LAARFSGGLRIEIGVALRSKVRKRRYADRAFASNFWYRGGMSTCKVAMRWTLSSPLTHPVVKGVISRSGRWANGIFDESRMREGGGMR